MLSPYSCIVPNGTVAVWDQYGRYSDAHKPMLVKIISVVHTSTRIIRVPIEKRSMAYSVSVIEDGDFTPIIDALYGCNLTKEVWSFYLSL